MTGVQTCALPICGQAGEPELSEGVGERLAVGAGDGDARVLERGAADAVDDAAGDRAGAGRLGRKLRGAKEGRGDEEEARERTGGGFHGAGKQEFKLD